MLNLSWQSCEVPDPRCLSPCLTLLPPVRPGPAEKLHVEAREGNTLHLSFSIPRTLVHFPAGLVYAIRHKSNWTEEWKEWETGDIKDKDSISLSLDGLDYAWTDYEIQVRALRNHLDHIKPSGEAPFGHGECL